MNEERKPAEVFHLADLIQEEMQERGWTITDLVMNMGPHFSSREWGICQLSWELFFACREKDMVLDETMANQLSDAFDVSPAFFSRYHELWRKASFEKGERG
jgi:hypothetical protein